MWRSVKVADISLTAYLVDSYTIYKYIYMYTSFLSAYTRDKVFASF